MQLDYVVTNSLLDFRQKTPEAGTTCEVSKNLTGLGGGATCISDL